MRLPFVLIPRFVDLELGLQTKSLLFAALLTLTARHCLIAAGAFALEQAAYSRHQRELPASVTNPGNHPSGSFQATRNARESRRHGFPSREDVLGEHQSNAKPEFALANLAGPAKPLGESFLTF